MCNNGELCLPPAPPQWLGPLAVRVGNDGPCPPTFDTQDLLVAIDAVPSSSCSCGCNPVDVECTATVGIFTDGDTDCESVLVVTDVSETCSESFTVDANARVQVQAPAEITANCGAPIPMHDIPEVETTPLRVCIPPDSKNQCGDEGGCFTTEVMSFDQLCVIRPGDLECPPNQPYSEKLVAGTEIADTRECPACDCNGPESAICGPIAVYGSDSCLGNAAQAGMGTCESLSNPDGDLTFQFEEPTIVGDCSPAEASPEPTGSATLARPLTLCCRR